MVRTTEGEIFNHALYPYFEQITASRPEQEFARWLDDKMEYVEWWYKNGDEGKQHFAVPYTDSGSRKRCFYVDFIVRLKSVPSVSSTPKPRAAMRMRQRRTMPSWITSPVIKLQARR